MDTEDLAALFNLQPITPGDIKASKRYETNYDWGFKEGKDDAYRGESRTLRTAAARRPGYQEGYLDGFMAEMKLKLRDEQERYG